MAVTTAQLEHCAAAAAAGAAAAAAALQAPLGSQCWWYLRDLLWQTSLPLTFTFGACCS